MLAAFALRNWKPLAGFVAVLALLALAGIGFWRGMVAIDAMELRAAETAKAERDAHWRAEISAANARAEAMRAAQALQAVEAEAAAGATVARLQTELNELEKRNASLPGGDACGLGRDRVRLLNGPR